MLKKKKNEKSLEEKVESLTKQIAEMKSSYDELQFTYNKSRCHEQELIEQSKVAQKEKKEMEEKIRTMVRVSKKRLIVVGEADGITQLPTAQFGSKQSASISSFFATSGSSFFFVVF